MAHAATLKLNTSAIKAVRYDPRTGRENVYAGLTEYAQALYREIMRTIKDGRVPVDAARAALEMATSEVDDVLSEESLSWADTLVHWTGGDRNRSGD